jgi:hypothetical protein
MSNSYVEPLTEDISLRDFALHIAPAFMGWKACSPLEWRTEDLHYRVEVKRAQENLEAWQNMSDAEREREYDETITKTRGRIKEANDDADNLSANYSAMIRKITTWDAPKTLWPLKDMMFRVIEENSYDTSRIKYEIPSFKSWCESRAKNLSSTVEYYERCVEREIERVNQHNEFMLAVACEFDAEVQESSEW